MIEITVKATTANLGPGFDCMGLALDIENKIFIKESNRKFKDERNLIYHSIKKIYDIAGKKIPGISIDQKIGIPIRQGLGSSAACIAAGCVAGNKLSGADLSTLDLIKIATEIEGHPDNIVPAFLGGYTISSLENGEVIYFRQKAFEGFKYGVMTPDFTLSTAEARKVLPATISYADAVFNIGKSSLMSAAMITGNAELLKAANIDKVHEPYRKHLIPNFDIIKNQANSLGALTTFLSGAGPTIISILKADDNIFERKMSQFLKSIEGGWALIIAEACNNGIECNMITD
ncbi:MAG: homoserine kinase [Clostridiales bacterium]|nr:homoserine kinase [Clostridiales bacterium]